MVSSALMEKTTCSTKLLANTNGRERLLLDDGLGGHSNMLQRAYGVLRAASLDEGGCFCTSSTKFLIQDTSLSLIITSCSKKANYSLRPWFLAKMLTAHYGLGNLC